MLGAHPGPIELVQGDLARQSDVDAVVNAANAELLAGGGVSGALHRAAGRELEEACRRLAPVPVGQAALTPGFDLAVARVVHAVGPRFGIDEPAPRLLADAYRSALEVASRAGCRSLAMPAISAGIYGYPLAQAAEIAVTTVDEWLRRRASDFDFDGVRLVRFVLLNDDAAVEFTSALDHLRRQQAAEAAPLLATILGSTWTDAADEDARSTLEFLRTSSGSSEDGLADELRHWHTANEPFDWEALIRTEFGSMLLAGARAGRSVGIPPAIAPRLLHALVRGDRVTEGVLDAAVADGTTAALIRAGGELG